MELISFPLLVYVVSRANLTCIHTNLAIMAKFMDTEDREEKGELVYYLTCLEGAVMYVSGLTDEDVKGMITTHEESPTNNEENEDQMDMEDLEDVEGIEIPPSSTTDEASGENTEATSFESTHHHE